MSMLVLSGCASTGEQNVSVAQTTPKAVAPEKAALPVEQRGTVWALSFSAGQNRVQIYADGEPEEIIETEWALLSIESDRAILTLKDRQLRFGIMGTSDLQVTEDLSIVSVELRGGQDITLNFANGTKERHPMTVIKIDPRLNTVQVKEYKGSSTPNWEKVYKR